MSTLVVKVCDARRRPLADTMDIQVVSTRNDTIVARVFGVSGTSEVRVEGLTAGEPYLVKVFPAKYRPVGQFVILQQGPETVRQLYAPLDPERVTAVRFPEYGGLHPELNRVLACSQIEGIDGTGAALYAGLNDMQRAGLLNLFAKMSSVGFSDAQTVWSCVDSVYRVRPDRIFVDVQPALRDLVKGAVAAGRFRAVSGRLHTPPPGFVEAGSFKTEERYGNLQLSFFASDCAPLAFKVDADIDNAAGIGHVFQVLHNWATDGTTHPYDVHEILVFRQEVLLPYELG